MRFRYSLRYRLRIRLFKASLVVKRYAGRVASATSQFLNVTLLFGKRPNESISGRAYRMSNQGYRRWYRVQQLLDFVFLKVVRQQDHCRVAYMSDIVESNLLIIEHERMEG